MEKRKLGRQQFKEIENNNKLKTLVDSLLNNNVSSLQLETFSLHEIQIARKCAQIKINYFILACHRGEIEIVSKMLRLGIDPNVTGTLIGYPNNALIACIYGRNTCLDILLQNDKIDTNFFYHGVKTIFEVILEAPCSLATKKNLFLRFLSPQY